MNPDPSLKEFEGATLRYASLKLRYDLFIYLWTILTAQLQARLTVYICIQIVYKYVSVGFSGIYFEVNCFGFKQNRKQEAVNF